MEDTLVWVIPTGIAIAISIIMFLPHAAASSPSANTSTTVTTTSVPDNHPSSKQEPSSSTSTTSSSSSSEYIEFDMDKWKSRRNMARYTCDSLVILILLSLIIYILSQDYAFDLVSSLHAYFPRETTLLLDIFNGIRGLIK